jgi:hypothetical protein
MLFNQGFRYLEVFQKILHSLQVRKIWFPASRPDDVSSRPDAQLSNASAIRTT